MGVVDNMVHTESSKVSSLSNGNHSEERLGRMPLQNGHYAPNGQLKFKRRRVSAVRDFPHGCEPSVMPPNLATGPKEVLSDTCENGDKTHNSRGNDSIRSSGAEVDSSVREASTATAGQQLNLESVDEKLALSSDEMEVCPSGKPESHQVNGLELMKVNTVVLPLRQVLPPENVDMLENSGEQIVLEPVEAQPLNMCLLDEEFDDSIHASMPSYEVDFARKEQVSADRRSNGSSKAVTKKYPPGGKVSAVRDFPPNAGSNFARLNQEKKNLLSGKSGVEDMPTKAYEKQRRKNIQDGNSGAQKAMKQDVREKNKKSASGDDGYGLNSRRQDLAENAVRDIVVYMEDQTAGREGSDLSVSNSTSQENFETVEFEKAIVQGLNAVSKLVQKPIHAADRKKAKKGVAMHSPLKLSKTMNQENGGESSRKSGKNSSPIRRTSQEMQPIGWDKEDSLGLDKESKDLQVARRPRKFDVRLPPSHPVGSSGTDGSRNKVKETLRLFQAVRRKLLQEEEAKAQDGKNSSKRVDYQASRILKDKGKLVNTGKKIIGNVPGVEVGDEFQYRIELNMIGLHKQTQGGIDYEKLGGQILCTSIVASGGYDNDLDNSDVLIYTGQGGNVMNGGKEPEDQKLERGNLALANSKHTQNPVRVIRGDSRASDDAKGRAYVYDGLYVVEDFWQETGPHGKLVFKFKLCRIPGQPELSWKILKKSKKSKFREGLCKLDISEGKERLPICAVNNIDDEKPPSFIYTVGMIYPDWCHPVPPKGCDCTTRCSESRKCSCVDKNGGGIPYNHDGAIVEAKSLVYECGPLCKCPPSCYNRVTQRGVRFPLEIFKTESRGWGVRSLCSIPSGSFICEYAGELLEDKEAERRTGNDEYLFDIGNNYDNSLWDGVSELLPEAHLSSNQVVDESCGFTIDAARHGNIGRFINHSCSPNLYAQNVLYEHEDTRIPHVMFFAMDNIPPLQELTYHYNYMMDQVRDANGSIKRKDCYCGSSECTGRLY